jgi:hypothetical protein
VGFAGDRVQAAVVLLDQGQPADGLVGRQALLVAQDQRTALPARARRQAQRLPRPAPRICQVLLICVSQPVIMSPHFNP